MNVRAIGRRSLPRGLRVLAVMAALATLGCEETIKVATKSGEIAGTMDDGVATFLGIPFASPPIGKLRWQPPHPPEPWTGTLATREWAEPCPQADFFRAAILSDYAVIGSEDCLYLNVWTPAKLPTEEARLAVMVFIHGGANELGSSRGFSSLDLYDGKLLAELGDVVVVNIAYRLGALGFMTHPALNEGKPGNWALLDQVEALKWVHGNIRTFGGDPERVTIFGESAGGTAVYHLIGSPLGKGLFARAIMQSAPLDTYTAAAQQAVTADIDRKVDCAAEELTAQRECLLAKPVEDLILAQPNTAQFIIDTKASWIAEEQTAKQENAKPALPPILPKVPAMGYAPAVDGKYVLAPPVTRAAKGQFNEVPMIIGTNRTEIDEMLRDLIREEGDFERSLSLSLGGPMVARTLIQLYPLGEYGDEGTAFGAIVSDLIFHCRARQAAQVYSAAQKQPVYAYVFDDLPLMEHAPIGVFHGAELFYLFQKFGWFLERFAPESFALQRQVLKYWTHFAKEGNPNHMAAPLWMPYETAEDDYLEIGRNTRMISGWRSQICDRLLEEVPEFFDAPRQRRGH